MKAPELFVIARS